MEVGLSASPPHAAPKDPKDKMFEITWPAIPNSMATSSEFLAARGFECK